MRSESSRRWCLTGATALAVALALLPADSPASDFPFVRRQPITAQITVPGAVAVAPGGSVLVSEPGRNRVAVFDPQGEYQATLSGLDRPISLAVDGTGRIFVGNAGRRNVEIYGADLALLGKLGSGDGEFGQPSGIAVDRDGDLYVADSKANQVRVYLPDGTLRAVIGESAASGSLFQFPSALAVDDATGELIVTDLADSFSSRGSYGGARVQVFTLDGTLLRSFGHYGRGEGLLVKPLGVATDGKGKVYVADSFQNVVEVFDRSGSYLGAVHDPEHPLRTPLGIALGERGARLYVCSLTAGRVESFEVAPPAQATTLTVRLAGDGHGTVASTPAALSCPGACFAVFPAGTSIRLDAAAAAGSVFVGWSGACVGAGACLLNVDEDLEAVAHFTPCAPPRRAPADFNGDGTSDILWRAPAGHQVSLWLIDPELHPHAAPLASARRQRLAGVADADGDGRADLLWQSNRGQVTLWTMEGASIAAVRALGSVQDPGWAIAGMSDFDGDGRADLLWRHPGSGELRLWRLSGSAGPTESRVDAVPGPRWEIAALADFDGDGRADVLWHHPDRNALRIWFMAGAAVRSSERIPGSPRRGANLVGCGDFDGDGRADLLWWTRADGGFSYRSQPGGAGATVVALANSPGRLWRPEGLGDYDGDGRADLLVRQLAGDEVAVCLTADPATLRCVPLGSAPGLAAAP